MPESPSSVLRQAAGRLRETAAAVRAASHTDWADRPWHVEACTQDYPESPPLCPCTVAQGERKPPGEPQEPLVQYIADAETPAHAAWIALMHTGLGEPLAVWLEETAEFLDGVAEAHGGVTELALHNSRHQMAVARVILGTKETTS